ncbi:hypothetical protein DFH06DRAFT_1136924 [Mycena polygramma]|nr:hypothetical protein DFH06DRAFT_1136924 [Mycena polygramma]
MQCNNMDSKCLNTDSRVEDAKQGARSTRGRAICDVIGYQTISNEEHAVNQLFKIVGNLDALPVDPLEQREVGLEPGKAQKRSCHRHLPSLQSVLASPPRNNHNAQNSSAAHDSFDSSATYKPVYFMMWSNKARRCWSYQVLVRYPYKGYQTLSDMVRFQGKVIRHNNVVSDSAYVHDGAYPPHRARHHRSSLHFGQSSNMAKSLLLMVADWDKSEDAHLKKCGVTTNIDYTARLEEYLEILTTGLRKKVPSILRVFSE